MKYRTPFLVLFFSLFFFLACEDSTPEISTIKYMVLYDYNSLDSEPIPRLGVYVQLDSDPSRIDSLTVYSHDSDFTWNIQNPLTLTDTNTQAVWVGSSNLRFVQGQSIPTGQYTVSYFDVAMRKIDLFFTIQSIQKPLENEHTDERIVLYDLGDNIVYFGKDLILKDSEIIKEQFPNVVSMQTVLLSDDGLSALVKPLVYVGDNE